MNSLSKKLMLGVVCFILAAGTVVSAENLVKDASPKRWHKDLIQNTEDKVGAKNSFQGNVKNIWAFSPGLIEVDPTKAYKLSGSLKSIGKDMGCAYFGLMMHDTKKRVIQRSNIMIRGSLTQLAADATVGDKVLKLKDCAKWNTKKSAKMIIAFDAEKDLSDLPNYNLSSGIAKLENKDDFYEITLEIPLKKSYPAGTKVRQHYRSSGYQYCAAERKIIPHEWTKYSAVVKGLAKSGDPKEQFWPGTKYVRVIVLINYLAKKDTDCKTLFDDILFVQVDEKK